MSWLNSPTFGGTISKYVYKYLLIHDEDISLNPLFWYYNKRSPLFLNGPNKDLGTLSISLSLKRLALKC